MEHILINPLTRISGFLQIEATINNGVIEDARNSGFLFRGFEKILLNRSPFDSVYFTQRICGICSAAHSMASSLALEDALSIIPSEQGKILRDIVHGCEFLQNHIRHFYQYTVPDYVRLPEKFPLFDTVGNDFRLSPEQTEAISNHYFDSLKVGMQTHEMLAVLGGKAPHNHGIFIGGVTVRPTTDDVIHMKSLLSVIRDFVDNKMVSDMGVIANAYQDYFHLGGGCGNLLSYGCFQGYDSLGTLYLQPCIMTDGVKQPFDARNITESIDYAWYSGKDSYEPFETVSEPDMQKQKAYSWIKAPRYLGKPFEVGPLARQILCGCYENHVSAMDRIVARVYETHKIIEILTVLLDQVVPGVETQNRYELPLRAKGMGLIDTTRGALGHWMKINEGKIAFYQIITPSVWNFSTRDGQTQGPSELSLIGTPIHDTYNPVEIGRILRSFDPCVSCATHVLCPGNETKVYQVVS
ncbi:nickel-dependent hydrogenase large subunit [Caproiciproducens galactitolivorans]|uniref:nickel-dependent hydrogenase large subunit n=1 Tax=Caproiciproducens galactitolivorans TaxID=642589 RepID=UPI0024092BDB|nr:nickel-dependent hydrogenase large subunit [Caproiciproducens galactitolivorans]